ncbi:phenylalanine--tRNA ligase alpha subunit [Anaeramoeba flamelloides]|uniref:phenylalanine--tRNA ligase n=1 Tax=Anaeramoeba flamelloides TaxID=1746091 RepID=A0ABQ8XPF7_9EUKA|nr:phenylalanine--tRNA ligase alpha subunit [Anaeramoeba flamelloides]
MSIESVILSKVKESPFDTRELSEKLKIDYNKLIQAMKSLEYNNVLECKIKVSNEIVLTESGKKCLTAGTPESRMFYAIPENGIKKSELMKQFGREGQPTFGQCMKCGWIRSEKIETKEQEKEKEKQPQQKGKKKKKQRPDLMLFRKVEEINDLVLEDLKIIHDRMSEKLNKKTLDILKRRKLITTIQTKSFVVSKGPEYEKYTTTQKIEYQTCLKKGMLQKNNWKSHTFKKYNFKSLGVPTQGGSLQPILKVRSEMRKAFLEMGFEEMKTNRYVESSFWNFDALFQPQQHPARDAHDTFFMKNPKKAKQIPEELMKKVKTTHEIGGYGSIGWRYKWSEDESRKNLLRTHTTAVSSRTLREISKEPFRPRRFFSIDRVFRNETLDATHLAEFHQVEGFIIDKNLSLGDLIGVISEFFGKLGMEKFKFKAAYNPYTEPSMEIFAFHNGLNKWIEIGNSGIFRPEMLQPLFSGTRFNDYQEDVNLSVIAWGLSVERPTMIQYQIQDIRNLVGHTVDLQMVKKGPICRLGFPRKVIKEKKKEEEIKKEKN